MSRQQVIKEYLGYVGNENFPCIAARAAVAREHVRCITAGNMACPRQDKLVLEFLYDFVDEYRNSGKPFHSAAIIFEDTVIHSENEFDVLLWQRLQALSSLDAQAYPYDPRVSADPAAGEFSFSIKSEAFFIIGLHPMNTRPGRRFSYPTIVFNPHAEFQRLRVTGQYEKIKHIVRKRDLAYSGSVNPMLDDFGNTSEALQYSGMKYEPSWQCPLKIDHGANEDYSAT